ncbi:MAG: hypothetical protein HDT30_09765 [Clostridiales bacterium]|nr:hypothetical protein [Clostridiales bacterium]
MKKQILSLLIIASLLVHPIASQSITGYAKENVNQSVDFKETLELLEEECGDEINIMEHASETISEAEAIEEIDVNQESEDVETIVENGEKYFVETYCENGVEYVKAYSEDMKNVSVIAIDGDMINAELYSKENSKVYEKNTVEIMVDEEIADNKNTVQAQSISYSQAVKIQIRGKYYYQSGIEKTGKKTKTYLKIGCNYNYRIRTDNLSDAKDKKVEAYKTSIKKSNSYNTKGYGYLVGTGISATVILALIIANATFPPSVIISIVVAAVGGGATVYKAIECYVDSYEYYLDAKDYYDTIKAYGTRI